MREIHIDLSDDNHLQQPQVFGGYAGEHNATILYVKLPARMLENECSGYEFYFQTSDGYETNIPYMGLDGDIVSCRLPEQITVAGKLLFNVVAITAEENIVSLKEKTNSVILHIDRSPEGYKVVLDPNGYKDELLQMIDERVSDIIPNYIDQHYFPESEHAQSGEAVAEAMTNSEKIANKVTSISAQSTDIQYPSAKAVYNAVDEKVDKVSGKGLSTNDYDDTEKLKVENTKAEVDEINDKIPNQATAQNQLADKNFVNSSLNSITAFYITKDISGTQFSTYAELNATKVFYSGGVVRDPTRNDYCIVQVDENHNNATTRYIYQSNGWEFQYIVNETALTSDQIAALNSGITSTLVGQLNGATSSPTSNAIVKYTASGKLLSVETVDANARTTLITKGWVEDKLAGKQPVIDNDNKLDYWLIDDPPFIKSEGKDSVAQKTDKYPPIALGKWSVAEGRGNNLTVRLESTDLTNNKITVAKYDGSTKVDGTRDIRANAILWIKDVYGRGAWYYVKDATKTNLDITLTLDAITRDVKNEGGTVLYTHSLQDVSTDSEIKAFMGAAAASNSHTEGTFCNTVWLNSAKLFDEENTNRQHAEGSRTLATGYCAHVEGENNRANGIRSHVEGGNNEGNGDDGHIEGYDNKGNAESEHIEGLGNINEATGKHAHLEGNANRNAGENAHVGGKGNSNAVDEAMVRGRYSLVNEEYAEVVGNGSDANNHSNAYTLDWLGNAWYSGNLRLGGDDYVTGSDAITKLILKNVIKKLNGYWGNATPIYTIDWEHGEVGPRDDPAKYLDSSGNITDTAANNYKISTFFKGEFQTVDNKKLLTVNDNTNDNWLKPGGVIFNNGVKAISIQAGKTYRVKYKVYLTTTRNLLANAKLRLAINPTWADNKSRVSSFKTIYGKTGVQMTANSDEFTYYVNGVAHTGTSGNWYECIDVISIDSIGNVTVDNPLPNVLGFYGGSTGGGKYLYINDIAIEEVDDIDLSFL